MAVGNAKSRQIPSHMASDHGGNSSVFQIEADELKSELRKLRSESQAEIKSLKNELIIAQERAKAALDTYVDSVATSFDLHNEGKWNKRREFDYGKPYSSVYIDRISPSENSNNLHHPPVSYSSTKPTSSYLPESIVASTSPIYRNSHFQSPPPKERSYSPIVIQDTRSSILNQPAQAPTVSSIPQYYNHQQSTQPYLQTSSYPSTSQGYSRGERLRNRIGNTSNNLSYDKMYLDKISGFIEDSDRGSIGEKRRQAYAQGKVPTRAEQYKETSFLNDFSRKMANQDDGFSSRRW